MENQETRWLLEEKYHGVQTPDFFTDCARLAAGEPLGFIIGSIPFLNCHINLDSKPLIPRPETEFWAEQAITRIKQTNNPSPRVLDLCAGSGAIGVAVAAALPQAQITFIELDTDHFLTIKKNIEKNTPHKVIYSILQSDLFSALTLPTTFDFILCNPPYIDKAAGTVAENVTQYEPHVALFGGTAGMEIITRIITEASRYLSSTGELWLEHEPAQVNAIQSLAAANKFHAVTHPDQYGTPRFSTLSMAL